MLSLRRLLLFASLLSGVHCAVDDARCSAAPRTPIWPFKGQQLEAQPREKFIRGLLSRQDLTCDTGYGVCPDLSGCCPLGGQCCSDGGCCASGEYCLVGSGCCPNGETCVARASKTPTGAIAGGSVGGVVVLAIGIFTILRWRRNRNRNRTQPLPAPDTGTLVTPTPAEQKHGSQSAYFPPSAQPVVSTLPSSAFVMSLKPAAGYSQHEVVDAQPMPSNFHAPYSEPQVVYAATAAPTTISSPGGTQPTNNWSP
ncbi:hypothetical protein B0H16DRAFT_1483263 [Mycena metata]|uniref:Uncharacterized protein n=1 Tax=Mycena metata TaxID=1033252 RepID=A0AAD7DXF2_9AGAR|nr:hypothetical protein B0H16DRAFT_1483263 [Mycena metata]